MTRSAIRPKDINALSNTEQAAMVLMSLDREQAIDVMRELSPENVQRLSSAILGMGEFGRGASSRVLQRFLQDVGAVSDLRRYSGEELRDLLDASLGRERGRLLGERIAALDANSQLSKLRWLDAHSIAQILRDEHPQLQAVLVACLPPAQGCQLLMALSTEQRLDLLERLAGLESISSLALAELEAVLASHLTGSGAEVKQRLAGEQLAAALLKALSVQEESELLAVLGGLDPERASRIEALMFDFSSLCQLPSDQLGRLLNPLAPELVAHALVGLAAPQRRHLLEACGRERRREVTRWLERSPSPGQRAVNAAQAEILAVARRMADVGEIVLDSRKLG